MKRLYFFVSIFLIVFSIVPTAAQITAGRKNSKTMLKVGNITSETKIDKVTVFADRSLVERTGKIDIPAGESKLNIEFLPQQIDPKSIRVNAESNTSVILGGVEVFYEHWTPETIQALKDSIQTIQDRLDELKIEEDGLAVRKDFVKSVASLGGSQPKDQKLVIIPQNLETTASFIENQLKSIAADKTSISQERRELNKKLKLLQEKLSNMTGSGAGRGYRVEIPIDSKSAGKLTVHLRYVIYNSSWSPAYDARYDDATGKVHLTYFGSITQSTSEDWKNAKIFLSTAQPQLGTQPPNLNIWYLRKYEPQSYTRKGYLAPREKTIELAEDMGAAAPVTVKAKYSHANALVSGENVVFEVSERKNIPSDGQIHKVVIAELTFDADKKFVTVPKLDQKVYLTAKCRNSSDYLLLPGEIAVFQGNDYVGTQYLEKSIAFDGEITLAMGPVQTIKVERKRVKEFSENTGIIGQNRREFFAFDITITNNSRHSAVVEVIDQIPVSADEKIKVEDVKFEPQPDKRDKDFDGQIIWKVKIDAGKKKILKYQFGVKYPKDITVQGL